MLQITIIGNLGADARIIEQDGRKFVSFNVAHTDVWNDEAGTQHKSVQWVSCALNGDGGSLLQYLVKGKTVYVTGRGSCRIYSSPKERKMVAGMNVSVDRIELLTGSNDTMPRFLVMPSGELINVSKAYYIAQEKAKEAGATPEKHALISSQSGVVYEVDEFGFVYRAQQQKQDETTKSATNEVKNA